MTHGHCSGNKVSPTYMSWNAMHMRVQDKRPVVWQYYGAKGIKVCERWSSFENFLADMGERPEGTTLDRERSDGDYEPDNCRWATWETQNRHRRHLLTFNGETHSIREWAKKIGVKERALWMRLKRGATLEQALT